MIGFSLEMVRKFFVGGNWKSNGTVESVDKLVAGLNGSDFSIDDVEAVVSPTFIHLGNVKQNLDKRFEVAAQNCNDKSYGAYTGEISPEALKDFGINWVILGHSERRQLYSESNELVASKIKTCLEHGLKVIACIGETLEERQKDETMNVIVAQLQPIVAAVSDWDSVVIAYEPIWAIGTGVTASPEQAQEVHKEIRQWFAKRVSETVAEDLRIIYGGSVKPNNCAALGSKPDVDGFLVGGASLSHADFAAILNALDE